MNTLVVFAHPSASSFNHALLEKVLQGLTDAGHEVRVKDLYADNFIPVLQADEISQVQEGITPERILAEQKDLLWADSLIFIYPLWWFGPPAILKGWFDSVLSYGFAFKHHNNDLCGLLTHSKALVLITTGSSQDWFTQQQTEDLIYRPVTQGTLEFCGVDNVNYRLFYNLSEKSETERTEILHRAYLWGENWDNVFTDSENLPSEHFKNEPPLISQVF